MEKGDVAEWNVCTIGGLHVHLHVSITVSLHVAVLIAPAFPLVDASLFQVQRPSVL